MPHECVSCGHVLEDGSDEVLEGCPECDGTTFSYVTEGVETTSDSSPSTETKPSSQNRGDEIVEAESSYERAFGGRLGDEDPEDLNGDEGNDDGKNEESTDRPETSVPSNTAAEEARRELMDQFETIRIVEPGSYELNLMNLYEEDEKIIALQEDGRYQVSLPTGFDD